jgi:hypothetical protein
VYPGDDQRAPVYDAEQVDTDTNPDHSGDAEGDRGGDGRARAETGRLQDGGREVDDGVDAGGLREDTDADADPEDPAHPGVRAQVAERGALVLVEVAAGVFGDDVVLLGSLLRAAAEVQDTPGVLQTLLERVPARRVRQEVGGAFGVAGG